MIIQEDRLLKYEEKIIHIGMPKCGSTYLQIEIFSKQNEYEFLGRPNADIDIRRNEKEFYKKKPRYKEIKKYENKSVIYSSEGLSNFIIHKKNNIKFIDNFKSFIEKSFGSKNITIILVVRNKADFTNSYYKQFLPYMQYNEAKKKISDGYDHFIDNDIRELKKNYKVQYIKLESIDKEIADKFRVKPEKSKRINESRKNILEPKTKLHGSIIYIIFKLRRFIKKRKFEKIIRVLQKEIDQ